MQYLIFYFIRIQNMTLCVVICVLMHFIQKSNSYYLLRAYYVLGIIIGTGDTLEKKK